MNDDAATHAWQQRGGEPWGWGARVPTTYVSEAGRRSRALRGMGDSLFWKSLRAVLFGEVVVVVCRALYCAEYGCCTVHAHIHTGKRGVGILGAAWERCGFVGGLMKRGRVAVRF